MRFFSGFSLCDDRRFFESYDRGGDYTLGGFSYGAIKAARYAAQADERIDTLQLFSPAFFQTRKESFKRLQLAGYLKDPQGYLKKFRASCFEPCPIQSVGEGDHSGEALEELLYFVWDAELMEKIRAKGTRIEVYLGLEDRIIDVAGARDFFLPYATVTSIRGANHFLQECL
ncbi:MAG: pimelyl-ACP methyl ester esterase BioV [Sulfuricurvum sp.]